MTSYEDAKGWITAQERIALRNLAGLVPQNGNILNIGVEYGASVWCLAAGAPSANIYAVDLDLSKAIWPRHTGLHKIEQSSYVTLQTWTNPIDLVFVDGDHSLVGIWTDIGFTKHIRPGGYIAFHDCYDWEDRERAWRHRPDLIPVNKAVSEWVFMVGWQELTAVDSIRTFQRPN